MPPSQRNTIHHRMLSSSGQTHLTTALNIYSRPYANQRTELCKRHTAGHLEVFTATARYKRGAGEFMYVCIFYIAGKACLPGSRIRLPKEQYYCMHLF